MPGIGSSINSAAKAVGEAIIKPTTDTLQTAATEGIVEPILGKTSSPPNQTNQQNQNPPANSKYTPAQRQNVTNFLSAMAAQDQASRQRQQQEAELKSQQEAEAKKQTEIRQIEVKKARRQQILNQAVYDKQRGAEIKKGGS